MKTFDEIMGYFQPNSRTFKALLNDYKATCGKGIVPFIGAGISNLNKDVYPTWTNILRNLNSEIIHEEKDEVTQLIDEGEYLEAADHLAKNKYYLFKLLREYCAEGKLEDVSFLGKAINAIPALFPDGLIITTNFDKVIEEAFAREGKRISVVFPEDNEIAEKLNQVNNLGCLLKLHGDLYSNNDKIIFTKSSYGVYDDPNSAIVTALDTFTPSKKFLFLGASLLQDKTLDVFQKFGSKNIEHYAILPCSKDKQIRRFNELFEEYKILPIFYPEGEYDCVTVLLERLLEDANPGAYSIFPAVSAIRSTFNKFDYRNGATKFIGRTEELQQLREFLTGPSSYRALWWAIVADGGVGKSRLMKEFCENHMPTNWTVIRFGHGENVTLSSLTQKLNDCTKNAFFVVDYLQTGTAEIASFLSNINKGIIKGSKKVRIVLLERIAEQKIEKNDDAQAQLGVVTIPPPWLDEMERTCGDVKDYLYTGNALLLEPLKEDAIKQVMVSYAEWLQKDFDVGPCLNEMYAVLEKIDKELLRPLFAIFIVDAKISNNDPTKWDRDDALTHFCKREREIIMQNIKEFCNKEDQITVYTWYLRLLASATMVNGMVIPNDEQPYFDFLRVCRGGSETEKKLSEHALASFNSFANRYYIYPLTPDLLGEFFVLEELNKALREPADSEFSVFNSIISCAKIELKKGLEFFFRLFLDYPVELTLIYSLNEYCPNLHIAKAYAIALVGCSVGQNVEECSKSVDKLGALYEKYEEKEEIAIEYEQLLFNLSIAQDDIECANSADKMQAVYEQFPNNADIAEPYARMLVNLSARQVATEYSKSTKELQAIYRKFKDNAEIAVAYTRFLYNLSVDQDVAERAKSTEKSQAVYEKFKNNAEIALRYAMTLVNLSIDQDIVECAKSADKVQVIYEKFKNNADIAESYARILVNLSVKQDVVKCEKSVDKLEAVHDEFEDNPVIAELYARILVNLSAKQDAVGCEKSTEKAQAVYEKFEDDADIAESYAKIFVNLSAKPDVVEFGKIAEKAQTVYEKFEDNPEIAKSYAEIIVNHSARQDAVDCKKSVDKLEAVYDKFDNNPVIAELYARILVNLLAKPDAIEYEKSTEKVQAVYEKFEDNPMIALAYVIIFVILSAKQDVVECARSTEKAQAIYEKFENNVEIALAYVIILVILSAKQDVVECSKSTEKVQAIYEKFEDNPEIAKSYARILVNLSAKQDAVGCEKSTEKAQAVYEKFEDNPDIAEAYARILVNLSIKQNGIKREKVMEKLQMIYKKFESNEALANIILKLEEIV